MTRLDESGKRYRGIYLRQLAHILTRTDAIGNQIQYSYDT